MDEQTNTSAGTGIVYILSNLSMDGYIKIGTTNGDSERDVIDRMRQLDTTGVPRAFNCEYAAVVRNPSKVEKALHEAFGDFRVRSNREFFEGIASHRVKAILSLSCICEVTPGLSTAGASSLTEDIPEKPVRAERFRFNMAQVDVGEFLDWSDDPEIRCEVIDEQNHVEYQGKRYTLSGLAKELKPGWKSVQGSKYWMFKGETLQERRERIESEEDIPEE